MANTEHLGFANDFACKPFTTDLHRCTLLSYGLGDLGSEGTEDVSLVKAKNHGFAQQKDSACAEHSQPRVQEDREGSGCPMTLLPCSSLYCRIPREVLVCHCVPYLEDPGMAKGCSPKLSISSLQFLLEEKRKHLNRS